MLLFAVLRAYGALEIVDVIIIINFFVSYCLDSYNFFATTGQRQLRKGCIMLCNQLWLGLNRCALVYGTTRALASNWETLVRSFIHELYDYFGLGTVNYIWIHTKKYVNLMP